MNTEAVREYCISLPAVTENLQWGDHVCFKIGGKMFAILPLGPEGPRLNFKASDYNFAELIEREGIIPAPYLARAKWVALQSMNVLRDDELRDLLSQARQLVFEKLPAKTRNGLSTTKAQASIKKSTRRASSKAKK
jgi:predicted DNA-binding protein (MmcQ/YjbR family)